MRNALKAILVAGLMAVLSLFAAGQASPKKAAPPKAKPAGDGGTVVIFFKDGHRQTIPVSQIARIEFNTPPASVASEDTERYEGEWKVGDGAGNTFFIFLDRNGTSRKSIGDSRGTWTVVDGEARITWDDGWHDAIRKLGPRRFEKVAFGPGQSFTSKPANVTDAEPKQVN